MPILRRRNRKPTSAKSPIDAPKPATPVQTPPARVTPTLGHGFAVRGEIVSHEDLDIDGTVRGRIVLDGHRVTVGVDGRVTADVRAGEVVIHGRVDGSVVAEDRVEILPTGSVQGDIHAPQVVLADGATCNGRINRTRDETLEWSRPVEIDAPLAAPARPAAPKAKARPKANPPAAAVLVPRVGHDHRPDPKPKSKAATKPRQPERQQIGWTFVQVEGSK